MKGWYKQMYRYQAKHKILSILLILALLILTSVMIFPSQASANAGVWEWRGPIPPIMPGPPMCAVVVPPMTVQKVVIELPGIGYEYALFNVELWGGINDIIELEYDVAGSWICHSAGHTITTDLDELVEVYLDTPIPAVNQVCVEHFFSFPEPFLLIERLQLIPPTDFGDAPDPTYPTLLASGGASHQITGLFLGAAVDGEPDGQPDATATGDDLNNDDEDYCYRFHALYSSCK